MTEPQPAIRPDAGHEGLKPQCPEGLLINCVELHRCVRDGGHEGPHWSQDRQREWPRMVLAEVECPW